MQFEPLFNSNISTPYCLLEIGNHITAYNKLKGNKGSYRCRRLKQILNNEHNKAKLHRGVGQTLFRAKTHNARHVLIQCIAVVSTNLCQQLLFLRSESQSGINKERMNIDTKGYVKRIIVMKKSLLSK